VRIDVITIFPAMIEAALTEGVVGRARARGVLDIRVRDLRDYTEDRHRTVDDVPYGGGPGMVMKPEPLFKAVEAAVENDGPGRPTPVILMTPQGRLLTHEVATRLSALERIVVICGRYEGVDERVSQALATDEISIGDYVLSGGELAALVIVDAVARLVPGVVGDAESVAADSFARGLLDYPHFTRPAEFRGWTVPEVLVSGHHARIEHWRRREALRRTLRSRPDLLAGAALDDDERRLVRELSEEGAEHEGD
jgi:tRNA (guanine37-N1)-methyltransferase